MLQVMAWMLLAQTVQREACTLPLLLPMAAALCLILTVAWQLLEARLLLVVVVVVLLLLLSRQGQSCPACCCQQCWWWW
jgi:hypothetical protein